MVIISEKGMRNGMTQSKYKSPDEVVHAGAGALRSALQFMETLKPREVRRDGDR